MFNKLWLSVQVEEGDNLALLLGLAAGLQQEPAVVERKADDLLHPVHDVLVAEPAVFQGAHQSQEEVIPLVEEKMQEYQGIVPVHEGTTYKVSC